MQKSKRLLGLVTAGLVLGSGLTACGGNDAASSGDKAPVAIPTSADQVDGTIDKSKVKRSLTVAVDNSYYLFHEDILVAEAKGYFKDVGIDKVKIVTIEDPIPALIGGSVDFAVGNTDNAIAAASKAKTGLQYLSTYLGGEATILGVHKGIDSAEDLKGKTLTGGQFGGRNDFLLRKLLTDNGLDPEKDVKIVNTGGQSNERLQSVISGTVDGATLQLRHKALLEAEGGKFLFQELRDVPQNGWLGDKILTVSPETAAAFLSATLKARQFNTDQANKDEVLALMAEKGFDLPQAYKDAYSAENDPNYHTGDGGFDVTAMQDFVEEQTKLEMIPAGTDWHDYVNPTALWRAQKSLDLPLRPSPEDFAK